MPAEHSALRETEMAQPSWFRSHILSTDHPVIGLAQPGSKVLSVTTYNAFYSIHGSIMVWLFAIPIVVGGFGNFLLPIMIGAHDVAFPRLNLLSYLLFPPARCS